MPVCRKAGLIRATKLLTEKQDARSLSGMNAGGSAAQGDRRRLLARAAWLGCAAWLAAAPGPGHAQPSAPDLYRLDARLDPQARSVRGHARIRWRNRSRQPLSFLIFHLYPNAFAGPRTVFMREQGFRLRGERLQRPGGIDVLSLRDARGDDLLARARTDLVEHDATQMRVELPSPLSPGAEIQLEIDFRVRLPEIVARMGASGDFFMVAQWFPKLAKLDPDGRFVSFPYHGLGEFYADFADYELRVSAPLRYVVAAPGAQVPCPRSPLGATDDARAQCYALPHALDIAWTAYPDLYCTRLPGRVRIDVCAPRGHLGIARAQAALVRDGIARLEPRLGPYPYRSLLLVLPPLAGWGAAGMEYPALILGWPLAPWSELDPSARLTQDLTSAHELAHQWFPITVASNELATPVLDEGLAEWLGLELLRTRYDRAFFERWAGAPLDLVDLSRAQLAADRPPRSALEPAYRYRPDQLAAAVYVRPALTLDAVARTWGRPRLWSALGRYARDNRFGHPGLGALWSAFDHSYWRGFARDVLRPALSARRFDPWHPLARAHPRSSPPPPRRQAERASAAGFRWLSRLLLWAQALLATVGP